MVLSYSMYGASDLLSKLTTIILFFFIIVIKCNLRLIRKNLEIKNCVNGRYCFPYGIYAEKQVLIKRMNSEEISIFD